MRTRSSLALIQRAFASVLALAAAIFLIGIFGSSTASAQANHGPEKVTIIVKMAPGLSENEHASTIARNGGTEKARVDRLSIRMIEVPAHAADAILEKYKSDPKVTRAEKSKQRQTDRAPVDPLFGSQWALPKIGWDLVFGTMMPTGTATVAVLDTGVNAAHPDLAGNVIAGTSILDGSSGMADPNGHGTWVAGIIAARSDNGEGIAGVGYAGVRVMPVTVLDADGLGQDADVIAGVVWAADNGANVILMAFSNPGFSESLQEAIDYAWARGVVLVAAAGNDGWSTPSFPAGDRGVMGVAATDENDLPAVFSNEGQSVFMAAPGTNIQTTDKVGYASVSGTSSSAAYVAGAAALLKAFDPSLTNGIIVGRLARTADPAGTIGDTGNGRLNLARALSDTNSESIQPAGADPVGSGGPLVGPYAAAAAKDGDGLITVNPGTIKAGTSGATFEFTFKNDNTGSNDFPSSAQMSLDIPAGWTAPTTGAGAGQITLANIATGSGACLAASPPTPTITGTGPWTITVSPISCSIGKSFKITYASVTAPATAGAYPFTAKSRMSAGAPLKLLADNQQQASITVTATRLAITTISPSSPISTIPFSVTVQAQDGLGNPATVAVSTGVSVTKISGSGTLSTLNGTIAAGAGQVVFNSATYSIADTGVVLRAARTSGDTLASGDSAAFDVLGHPTTTTASPTPFNLAAGGSQTVTFTVVDTVTPGSAKTTPTGSISFTAVSGLTLSAPSCALTAGPGNSANCTVNVSATVDGSYTLVGTYSGDSTHATSSGSASINADVTPPVVTTISRANPNPTNAASVSWNVTFSESVAGVNAGDFALVASGVTSASITGVTGSGNSYVVTANTGTGSGTLGLNLVDNDSIIDGFGNQLGGVGTGGIFTGEVYNLDRTPPVVLSIDRASANPTNLASVTWNVTFSEDVSGVDTGDFALAISGVTGAAITGVTGSGASYVVTASTGTGNGTLGLNLVDNDTVIDGVGNNLGGVGAGNGSFTGQVYDVEKNVAPVSADQSVTTNEDTFVVITLSATDADGNTLTFNVGTASNGTLTDASTVTCGGGPWTCTMTVKYTPASNFSGSDSFTFTTSDGIALSNTATVSITVSAVNDPPTANTQTVGTNEDTPVAITLIGSDLDSASLSFTLTGSPANGGLSAVGAPVCTPSGSGTSCTANVTYTPAANFNGTDSFKFKVNDGSADSTEVTVFVNVNSVNDTPVAASQSVSTNEDTPLVITLSANDVDGATLTFNLGTGPTKGILGAITPVLPCTSDGAYGVTCTATVTYTPNANYNGPDGFTFTVSDGSVSSPAATVSINVVAVNDPPEAMDFTPSLDEDSSVVVELTAVDIDSTSLNFSITSSPSNGSLSAIDPVSCTPDGLGGAVCKANVTYTPTGNFNGTDTFKYRANDGTDNSNEATVTLTVRPVNDTPTANSFSVTTDEDVPGAVTLQGNDLETDSASLTYNITQQPANGQLTGTGKYRTYTPNPNFHGTDTIKYTVTDRGDPDNCSPVGAACAGPLTSTEATVTITVRPVNDPPTANGQSGLTVAEDSTLAITLTGSDLETPAASLSFAIASGPSNGVLLGTAPNVTYKPNPNYNGPDSFTFTVTDRGDPDNCSPVSATCAGPVTSTSATVSITVTPVNDAPVAVGGTVTTLEDNSVTFTVTGSDVDNLSFGFVVGGLSNPAAGTLTVNGSPSCSPLNNGTGTPGATCTQSLTFTPALNFNTTDDGALSFTFMANDGELNSGTATVNIVVTPVNDPPANLTMTQSAASINENDSLTVSGTFTDPDKSGNSLSVTVNWGDGTSSLATISGSATAGYSYSAIHAYVDDDPTGTSSDAYPIGVTVSDGQYSSSANASVTVNNVAPVAGAATGPGPIQKGSTATVSVPFTDVGSLDTHTCTFSWDDLSPNTTVAANPTTRTCQASHPYPLPGVYEVGITITDDDTGFTTTSFKYVVVYDPTGGFVTGGGWINSPAGAYRANVALVGKANFGFVSKYQKGATIPTGETEFQFQAGDFKFKSTSYEWLVVSGAKAQYKGVGMVNGVAGFSFLLTAYDGDGGPGNNASGGPDKFRIKVMGNGGGVVYDNNVSLSPSDDIDSADPQALGGGSIVVHK